MPDITVTAYKVAKFSCGHTKTIGINDPVPQECWCHAPLVELQIIRKVKHEQDEIPT